MLVRIFVWLGIFIAISLVILWIVSGGIGKITERSGLFGTGTSTLGVFRLPWQPEFPTGPDLSSTIGHTGESTQNLEQELLSLQKEYEALEGAARSARDFGMPSPHRGTVVIEGSERVSETDSNAEYLRLVAAWDNTAPINITGWSLQSALTGVRAYVPRGAYDFRMGVMNEQRDILLNAGASVIVMSGSSPVGTSFRENMCTGYLNQLQTFSPRLSERCPSPYDAVPVTADTLNLYGDACVDFAHTLHACEAPLSNFPAGLSTACRAFLANTLSYNGCIDRYRYRANFAENTWRVFLDSPRELWRNTHDVIRLLDGEGRTVDAITY